MSQPLYTPAVLDHFAHPRNTGPLPGAAVRVEAANPVCGDILALSAAWDGERITAARFEARGCVTAMACGSLLTVLLTGRTPAEAAAISAERIAAELGGLPPASYHGAQLARDALNELLARLK